MIVVDASALVEAALRRRGSAAAADRLFADGADLHAPHHIDVEVLSALRGLVRRGVLTLADARLALDFLGVVLIHRHELDLLRDRVWALRNNFSAYDGAYVALAEALRAPLVTCDARIARAPGHAAKIEFVAVGAAE